MSHLTVDLQADDGESRSRRLRQRTAGFVFVLALLLLLVKAPPPGGNEGKDTIGTQTIETQTIGTQTIGTETIGKETIETQTIDPTQTEVVPPMATAPPPQGRLEVTPPAIDPQIVGRASRPAAVTFANSGDATLRIDSIVSSNPAFGVGSDDCSGRDLAPGATCLVGVVFRPAQRGSVTGRWTITDDRQQQHFVELTGKGLLRKLVIDPGSIAFGQTPVGTMSERRLRVTNVGDVDVRLESVDIEPADSYFAIAPAIRDRRQPLPGSCQAGLLAPGQSCDAIVTFAARIARGFRARVIVRGAGGVEEASAPVSAFAVQPPIGELRAEPSPLTVMRTASPVVVTNVGNAPVAIRDTRLDFTDGQKGWIAIRTNGCTGIVAPGDSCSVAVQMVSRPQSKARLILDIDGAASPTFEVELVPPRQTPPDLTTLTTTRRH